MDEKHRIVTNLPLRELWLANTLQTNLRGRSLSREDITELLRGGPVQFVVADVGFPFNWAPFPDCHQFWKTEVKPHLAAGSKASLEEFPGRYCYFASQWDGHPDGRTIVLLEKHH